MAYHVNSLLADHSHVISSLFCFNKSNKIRKNVVFQILYNGALRIGIVTITKTFQHLLACYILELRVITQEKSIYFQQLSCMGS